MKWLLFFKYQPVIHNILHSWIFFLNLYVSSSSMMNSRNKKKPQNGHVATVAKIVKVFASIVNYVNNGTIANVNVYVMKTSSPSARWQKTTFVPNADHVVQISTTCLQWRDYKRYVLNYTQIIVIAICNTFI